MSDDKLKSRIAAALYKACEDLGADADLLSIIGSYGDTLDDDDIANLLEDYNERGKIMDESRLQ